MVEGRITSACNSARLEYSIIDRSEFMNELQTSFFILVLLSQVGIFRKSGVKSRIAKLREVIEESMPGDTLDTYDLQQAYDVADMLKQYFRELPDSLLTTKMSDTFVGIFQRKQHIHSNPQYSIIQVLCRESHKSIN